MKQALLDANAPVLLVTRVDARYGLMPLIDDLRDEVGRRAKLGSLWMLLPMAATGLPTVDDVPVRSSLPPSGRMFLSPWPRTCTAQPAV